MKINVLILSAVTSYGCKTTSESQLDERNPGRGQLRDFLISDVCLDSSGKPITMDPANKTKCLNRRNINSGETLPYYRTDFATDLKSVGYQRSDSVPFNGGSGEYILKTFDFGGPNMTGFKFGQFEDQQDGFDITEFGGDFASYIHTKDGSGSDNYWAGEGCLLDDGWVLFPTNFSTNQFKGSRKHSIKNVPVRNKCGGKFDTANVDWEYLPNVSFTGGQNLPAISTFHFDSKFKSAEVNYYTREYGATRWEAWVECPKSGCPAESSLTSANACNGIKITESHGKKMYRSGCRDWTKVVLQSVPFPRAHYKIADYRICVNMSGAFDSISCK